LTGPGETAEEALSAYDQALGRRGALQAVALVDIAEQLRALVVLARQPTPDPAKVHLLLRGLVDRFTGLADNAQAFMASLQRSMDLHEADAEAFRAYKDRLIDYLQRFIADLVTTGADIAGLVAAVEAAGADRLLDAAARREAADTAPSPGQTPGQDPREREFEQARALWHERWSGFRAWFVSGTNFTTPGRGRRRRGAPGRPAALTRRSRSLTVRPSPVGFVRFDWSPAW
jgi:uncharacterized protein (TIGR02677 family)